MAIIFLFFCMALAFQLLVWVGVLGRVTEKNKTVATSPQKKQTSALPAVSIVICFRNEAARLQTYLPLILKQDYPSFEVIAVDDFSEDQSAEVVKKMAARYPALQLVQPPEPTRAGKKDALTFGIQQAKNDILLLTDADCAPVSGHWIREMTADFINPQTEVMLGYSPYRYASGSVNSFQRYETVYTALQYFGFAQAGMPYMGVGRNLAYRKKFFTQAGGVDDHAHLPGGDDDLLISHHAEAAKTALVIKPAAWTLSDSATSWRDYLSRKFRHLGVSGHYPLLPKLVLAGLGASHFGVYLFGILGFFSENPLPFLLLLILRWCVVVLVVKRSPFTGKLPAARAFSIGAILVNDFLLALYYLVLLPAPLLNGRQKGGWE